LEPELNELLEQAKSDPDAVGLVLIGSYASGTADEESDLDVLYVMRDGVVPPPRERRGRVEFVPTALDGLRNAPDWFKPALAHARVLLDESGDVVAAIEAARRVSRDETAELYDGYLNDLYRSLKAWRRGNELAGRIEAGRSLRYLGELLFALGGTRGPYPKDWPGKLGELEPLVLEVARTADPTTQQKLARRVRALARDYEDVYAGWEGEIDRVLGLDFE
jgi:predicted nucleotidyltransferase